MMNLRKIVLCVLFVLPIGFVRASGDAECPICLEKRPQIILHRVNAQAGCHASCIECAQHMFVQHEPCNIHAYLAALLQGDINANPPCQACAGGDAGDCANCRHCNRQCPVCREPLGRDDIRNIREGGIPVPKPGEPVAAADGSVAKGDSPYLVPAVVGTVVGGLTIATIAYLVWKHRKNKKGTRTHASQPRARAAA